MVLNEATDPQQGPHRRLPWLAALLLGGYTTLLLCTLSRLSLWLDELIEISQTRELNLVVLLRNVSTNPGGVPLGYLIEALFLHVWGISAWAARLPSLLFGAGACVLVFLIARRLDCRFPLLSAALFALFPIQIRYCLEARPYEQGVFFSLLATWFLVAYYGKPNAWRLVLFWTSGVLALYSQPYSILPLVAQAGTAFLVCEKRHRNTATKPVLALLLALFCLVPWLVYAHAQWSVEIEQTLGGSTGISVKSPLLILKELTGSGYSGSLLLILFCAIAVQSSRPRRFAGILSASIVVPILLVLLLDAATGYFLAIRQVLFVLPSLAILSAAGIETLLLKRQKALAAGGLLLLAIAQGVGIWGWFARPRQDWAKATTVLTSTRAVSTCIVFEPPNLVRYFAVFDSTLLNRTCTSEALRQSASIAIARLSGAVETPAHTASAMAQRSDLKPVSRFVNSDLSIEILGRK